MANIFQALRPQGASSPMLGVSTAQGGANEPSLGTTTAQNVISEKKPTPEETMLQQIESGTPFLSAYKSVFQDPEPTPEEKAKQEKREKATRNLAAISDVLSLVGKGYAASQGAMPAKGTSLTEQRNAHTEKLRQEYLKRKDDYSRGALSAQMNDMQVRIRNQERQAAYEQQEKMRKSQEQFSTNQAAMERKWKESDAATARQHDMDMLQKRGDLTDKELKSRERLSANEIASREKLATDQRTQQAAQKALEEMKAEQKNQVPILVDGKPAYMHKDAIGAVAANIVMSMMQENKALFDSTTGRNALSGMPTKDEMIVLLQSGLIDQFPASKAKLMQLLPEAETESPAPQSAPTAQSTTATPGPKKYTPKKPSGTGVYTGNSFQKQAPKTQKPVIEDWKP